VAHHAKGDRDEGDCLVHIHAADGRCSSSSDGGAFAHVVSATGGSRGSHCGTTPLLRVKLPC
jgi:hypothetical protein